MIGEKNEGYNIFFNKYLISSSLSKNYCISAAFHISFMQPKQNKKRNWGEGGREVKTLAKRDIEYYLVGFTRVFRKN